MFVIFSSAITDFGRGNVNTLEMLVYWGNASFTSVRQTGSTV